MTNGQASGAGAPMQEAAENAGGVSGMVNLNINLPDNLRLVPVDSDETEETEVANATGTIVAFAGGTAPAGWLLCNGAAISRATYADLFAVIGTDYGLGNANTTFNLPDFRGRVMVGVDNMGGVSADRVTATEADELGGSGGTETQALTVDELPEHTHDVYYGLVSGGGTQTRFRLRSDRSALTKITPDYTKTLISQNPGTESFIAPTGTGTAHNNMPPYQTVNYIIKT